MTNKIIDFYLAVVRFGDHGREEMKKRNRIIEHALSVAADPAMERSIKRLSVYGRKGVDREELEYITDYLKREGIQLNDIVRKPKSMPSWPLPLLIVTFFLPHGGKILLGLLFVFVALTFAGARLYKKREQEEASSDYAKEELAVKKSPEKAPKDIMIQ